MTDKLLTTEELADATEEAIRLIVGALAGQLDTNRLEAALHQEIESGEDDRTPASSDLALRFVRAALETVESFHAHRKAHYKRSDP